jgi:hypothetical protein
LPQATLKPEQQDVRGSLFCSFAAETVAADEIPREDDLPQTSIRDLRQLQKMKTLFSQ